MKVLLAHEDAREPGQGGGAESLLRDETRALQDLGHEVAWLQSGHIQQAVEVFQPDIVHVQTIHNLIGFEPVRWLQEQNIPHLWAIMDYWPFCFGRMLLRGYVQGEPCSAVDGACDGRCERGRSPAEWLQVVNGSPVVALNRYSAGIYRRNGMRCDYVVELGVDTELFQPGSKGDGIVTSSAWPEYPVKGMPVLKAAIEGTGLEVGLLAHMPRAQVAAGLRDAGIYVFPSIYEETWGLCLNEAMACGCACIASDVAGARAQIEPGVTGLLVEKCNPEALRAAILRLVQDRPYRERLGQNAREHCLADHTLEAMGRRWVAVYQSILEGQGNGGKQV